MKIRELVPSCRKGLVWSVWHSYPIHSLNSWLYKTIQFKDICVYQCPCPGILHMLQRNWKNRYQRPRRPKRGSAAVRLLGLRVRILPKSWMSVSCICYMWSDRAGHSTIGVLPSVVCLSVISKPQQWEGLSPVGLSSHEQKICECWLQKRIKRKGIIAPTNVHDVEKYFN
jgi:hypothetical protein